MRRRVLDIGDWYEKWESRLIEDYEEEYPGSYDDRPSVHPDGQSNKDHFDAWVDKQYSIYLEGDV